MTSLPRTQLRSILWIIFAAAIFTGPSAFALDVAKRTFDLPADDAEKTLKLFAQQSGEQILYPPTEVSGVQTNAVKGQMTPGEALSVMLDHTILIVVHDEKTGGYAIHRAVPAEKVEKKDDSRREERSATTDNVSLDSDKTVVLSPFTVMANVGDDRYEPTEASSGGRVRVNIFESSQNVSVISLEVMRDAGADRVLDAMKFVPGVSESSIPNGLDRMNIRGFLTTSRTLDGITTQYSDSQGNIDPFIVERLEIVKGPNSILAPAANPGGTINNVSKKPGFTDFGSVAIALGGFDAGRVEVDLNHVDPAKKLAVRVLSAMEDEKDYFGSVSKEHLLAPMFTYKFSPTTEITWQIHYIDHRIQNYYDGIAIDPTAGTTNRALLYQGVPRSLTIYGPDSYRNDGRVENSLLFLTRLADSLSLRVQGRHSNEYNENNSLTTLAGSNSSAGTNANSFNPNTGLYTPGIVYASASPYATTPVVISPTFNRSGSRIFLNSQHDSVQVDLHHEYRTERVQAQTLFGYAYNYDRGFYLGYALTAPAVTLTNFVYSPDVVGVINRTQQYYSSNNQAYVSEKISLLNKRVILDGSYSRDYWDISIDDRFQGKKVTLNPSAGLVSYGLVVKPRPDVDFFYTHSQNAAILPIANLATAPNLPIQNGVMDEEGMRVLLRDNRIRLTLSHYEILQNNTNVSNPANFAYPPPVPALPGLLTNRVSRGWEFEAQGAITKELSLVCAYTNFKNRNPFGQQFRGVAERTAAALLNYSFDRAGKFKGLATSVGVDYEGKRAGDDATGFTSLGVPRATTFYLPARTLVNVTLSYEFWNNWRLQTYIDNVLNQEYLAADLSRGSVWAGTPRNLRAKLTYKF